MPAGSVSFRQQPSGHVGQILRQAPFRQEDRVPPRRPLVNRRYGGDVVEPEMAEITAHLAPCSQHFGRVEEADSDRPHHAFGRSALLG